MNYYKTIQKYAGYFMEDYYDEDKPEHYLYDSMVEFWDGSWYGFLRSDWCDDRQTELSSAVKVIEESESPETDKGLWEGEEPKQAIKIQALYTALRDFEEEVRERIEAIEKDN